MGLKDIINASKIRAENDTLKEYLTPEMQNAVVLHTRVQELEKTAEKLDKDIQKKQSTLTELEQKISDLKKKLITFEDDIIVQEFGLYQPRYSYTTSDEYKAQLSTIRERQKTCIKSGKATTGNMNFTYNNSASKGRKMVTDMQKLLLRAFNSECDEIVRNVKYNNFDMSLKKMCTSSDAVAKLGKMLSICITPAYFDLKKQELILALEYQIKKQDEKEALKQARADMREQAKLEKELEEQRKKIEKEQTHYQTAYQRIQQQLQYDPTNQDLLNKKSELEQHLSDIDTALSDIDYRQANMKAGYVYVISNIGAFGKDVYKIGMTRRLDPQERIDELGSASVPFNFDVHAMIFSDDAPALEAALHRAFENKKLNMVNQRREFFHVTLDEIKKVIKENFDKTVEFVDVPDAEQYRISLRLHSGAIPVDEREAPILNIPPRQSLEGPRELLRTKWGTYIMPEPYTICLKKGPRKELQQV